MSSTETENEEIVNISCDSDESSSTVDGEQYVVEKIVDERPSKFGKGRKDYLIKWEGYHSIHNTWEDSKQVKKGAMRVVLAWEREKEKKRLESIAVSVKRKRPRRGKRTLDCLCADADAVSSHSLVQSQSGSSPSINTKKRRRSEEGRSETGSSLSFKEELEERMNSLKNWVVAQQQQSASTNHENLKKEIENLKHINSSLVQDMKNLNLFMLHRKNPEAALQHQVQQLGERLNSSEFKHALLQQAIKNRDARMEELDTSCDNMRETLEDVAQFFEKVLGKDVPFDAVQSVIPQVKKIYLENAAKARKVDSFKRLLLKE